jgi:hypothetical protein
LAEISAALAAPDEKLAGAVERHLSVLDDRLAAMGRLRERVRGRVVERARRPGKEAA